MVFLDVKKVLDCALSISRVILDESFHGRLDDCANGDAQLASGLGEDFLLQQGDRAYEIARQFLVVGIACHVANEEIGEGTQDERAN